MGMDGTDQPSIDLLRERFRRNGFVHARNVLPKDEVARFGRAVDEAVASRKVNDNRRLEEKSLYEQSFIQCQNLWEDWPDVRALSFDQRIAGLAAALIGASRLRLWHDQALYKEPGGRDTDAHQDHPYWPIEGDRTLTAWIPLMDIDDETGCMGYVPGSHRGEREFVNIFTEPGSGAKLLERYAPALPVFVPCEAGDVLFHHGSTAHLARPNRSTRMRRVHTAIYFADGAVRSETPRHHPSVDRAKIEVGSAIASDVTPIAWPIEDGVLPVPVPWPDSERVAALKKLGIVPDRVR
jgi:ectoine hydroxylase-related dioxygenase (phytanoyl-CoA dioxygenase family)